MLWFARDLEVSTRTALLFRLRGQDRAIPSNKDMRFIVDVAVEGVIDEASDLPLRDALIEKSAAAVLIQRWWRRVVSDPGCHACRRRLQREFDAARTS